MENSIAKQFDEVYSEIKVIEKEERLIRQRKNEQTEKRFELCKNIISTIKETGDNKTFVLFQNNKPELIVDRECALMPFYEVPDEYCPENITVGYYKTYEFDNLRRRDEVVEVMVVYPKAWFEGDSWVAEYKAVFNSLISKEETEKENKQKQKDIKEKKLFLKLKQKFEPQTSEKL